MDVAKVSVAFEADTSRLEQGAKKAEGIVGGFGNVLQGAASVGFGALAAGAVGAVAGLGAATKSAADFQSQISGIAAVGGAEAVDRMSEISAKALQVGKDTSFSASQAAAGMEELIKAGVSISDVLGGATDATVALAAATGVDLATSAEIASNAMNTFSLAGEDVGKIADIVAGAANASAIDVNDFKFSLAAAGAVANTIGLSFQDTAVAIAELGQAGLKGSDAGTSLKTLLLNLTPATDKAAAEMKNLGIMTADGANRFFDAAGKAKPLVEIQGVLADATKNLSQQQKLASLQIIFGTDAIRAAAILSKAGAEGYSDMADAMGKVSAADVAKTRLDNLNGSMEALKGSLETAGITIGTALLPALKQIVDGAIAVLNENMPLIEDFANKIPGAMAATGTFITGTLMPALGNLATALGPPLRATLDWLITTGWPTLVTAATAFSGWMNTTGIPALTRLTTALGPPLNAVVTWLTGTGFPGLFTGITGVSTAIQDLTGFLGGNTAAQSILAGALTAGATAWGLMTAATLAHTIATKAQTIATGLASAAQWALNAALTANPIGIVVVALAGLTAAILVAYNQNEAFRKGVDATGESLKNFWTWAGNSETKIRDIATALSGLTGGDAWAGLQALGRLLGRDFGGGGAGLQRTSLRLGGMEGTIGGDAMSLTRGGGGGSAYTRPGEIEAYIREAAPRFGIEAGKAVAVALSEGGLDNPVRQSDVINAQGEREMSFGPFQLYMNGGLGNEALKAGIDPRDPAQWKEAIDFALQKAAQGGWGPWHGAARAGIGDWEGISGGGGGGMRMQWITDQSTAQDQLAASTDRLSAAQVRAADAERLFGSLGASATTQTQALGTSQQYNAQWAQTMADQQTRLAQVLQGQVNPASIQTGTAMANLSAVLGPIERQVAGGAISMDTLQFKLVDLARATGLATAPWRDYQAGLIDINEAMMRVVLQSADAGPQFEALRQQLGTTNAITDQGALSWLQLALNYQKATPALQANAAATTTATSATSSLNSAVGTVNSTMDPGQYQQVTAAVNEMTGALGGASSAFGDMGGAASGAQGQVESFQSAADSLASFLDSHTFEFKVSVPDIPDWATPGSPMPLETALWGLNRALRATNRVSAASLRDLEMPSPAAAVRSVTAGGGSGGGGTATVNHYEINIPGFIGTKDELVDALHAGLLRKKRRNGRLGLDD